MSKVHRKTTVKKKSLPRVRGRGTELLLHGRIQSKRDPDLQKRIDMVVADALAAGRDHNTDVMTASSKLKFISSGLKVHRVG